MKTREKIVLLTTLIYIIYNTIPILAYFADVPPGSVNIFTLAVIIITSPKAFVNKASFWAIAYIGYLFICHSTGKILPTLGIGDYGNIRIITIESAFILPALAIANVLIYYNNKKLYMWVAYGSLIAITIEFIYLTPILILYKNALRSIVEDYAEITSPIIGLPHYSLTHAYVIILLPLLYGVKRFTGKLRWLFAFFSLYLFFILFSSGVATNIFISLIFSVLFFFVSDKRQVNLLGLGVFIVVVGTFLYYSGIIEFFIGMLIDLFEGSTVQSKLIALKDFLTTGEMASDSAFKGREDLHQISIDAFFANPIVGTYPVGNHSSILDRLGGLGILGFVPYVMLIYCSVNMWYKRIVLKSSKTFFILGVLSAIVLLYQKGIFGQEGWLFCIVLLPAIIIIVERGFEYNTKAESRNMSR